MTPRRIGLLRAVLAGKTQPYSRPGTVSAIAKTPRLGPVEAGPLGLAGDEQGDLRVHGGLDKAIHCYAWSHYEFWRSTLDAMSADLLAKPGAFGENFSLDGLSEEDVCIGDRLKVGTAHFEVSQGRQPCWKLNDRFNTPDMAKRVQDSGRAGWYLRTTQPGEVAAGNTIYLIARPFPEWSIERLLALIAARSCDPDVLYSVLRLPLPASWQKLFQRRRENRAAEDWSARLRG